jgi:hypothetical protein
MNLTERIHAFSALGDRIAHLSDDERTELTELVLSRNAWFTPNNVNKALAGIAFMLQREKLESWTEPYHLEPDVPKIVGIVMAGNIPAVGFHDLLCVLLSGNVAAVKLSSQDEVMIQVLMKWLVAMEPRFKKNLEFRDRLDHTDAVIATGSDNTARYFDYYFGKQPNIIRKNRTSVAVLDGTETPEELTKLGDDIFSYFGLGCRNVSKLFVPKGYDITILFPYWEMFSAVGYHHKYNNNYDYHKSILLVNRIAHLDTGFLLARETEELVSPTSLIYYQRYTSPEELRELLNEHDEKIQCVVGHGFIPFGEAQSPEPWDYADGVDVLKFLEELAH